MARENTWLNGVKAKDGLRLVPSKLPTVGATGATYGIDAQNNSIPVFAHCYLRDTLADHSQSWNKAADLSDRHGAVLCTAWTLDEMSSNYSIQLNPRSSGPKAVLLFINAHDN